MTTRQVGSDTYVLTYDAENRLVQVKKNGNTLATFVYGPGGERVKGTVNGVATVYVGEHYEVQGGTIRKYYYAGTQRVAMRENGTLYFLLTDHLGSTAITANGASGAKVAEVRYKAWGEDRYTSGTTPTTYRYTGQRWEAGLGLYFYRARWYDPALGRFAQPDTLVPNPGDPQSLNRYAYVQNNPLRFTDPTGHWIFEEDPSQPYFEPPPPTRPSYALPVDPSAKGVRITQGFGKPGTTDKSRAVRPGQEFYHPGIDISAEGPVNIYSMLPGTVIEVGSAEDNLFPGFGNYVTVESGDYIVTYMHLAEHAGGLTVGTKVKPGDVLGVMGDTGTGGHHVHVEMRIREGFDWEAGHLRTGWHYCWTDQPELLYARYYNPSEVIPALATAYPGAPATDPRAPSR